MNEIVPFNFESVEVRVIKDEQGEPWFIAKDICDVLGIQNVSKACNRLKDNEKNTITNSYSIRGNPNTLIVSESGLYKLIMQSRKPEAEKFQDWVSSEVLPSIRKTGKYSVKATDDPLLATMHTMIALREEQIAIKEEVNINKAEIREIKDRISNQHDTGWVTAKGYAIKMNLEKDQKKITSLARKASKLAKEKGIKLETVHDEKWGRVNIYPIALLHEVYTLLD